MRANKLAILFAASLFATGGFSATVHAEDSFETSLEAAVAGGQSLADYVASAITANPDMVEAILALALDNAGTTEEIEAVLAAASNANVDSDTILAVAVAKGVDPAVVENAVANTETAAGNRGKGQGQGPEFGLTRARSRAAAPATPGFGGGSGGGGGTVSGN